MTEQEIRDALKREPVMPVIVDVWVERCDSLLTIIASLREQVEAAVQYEAKLIVRCASMERVVEAAKKTQGMTGTKQWQKHQAELSKALSALTGTEEEENE